MLLFHATFRSRVGNIRRQGLRVPNTRSTLSYEGQTFVPAIYFAKDIEVAISFAEAADNVTDRVYDSGIVVLAVEHNKLNQSRFGKDPNNISADTLCYYENIPREAIYIINMKNYSKFNHMNVLEPLVNITRINADYICE